jgi:hypothetical protein
MRISVAACKHLLFRPELFENIQYLRPELNANKKIQIIPMKAAIGNY